MAYERLQAGANSATFFVTGAPGATVFIPETEWALLPEGKLKTLLNRPYALPSPGGQDYVGLIRAFAMAGGTLVASSAGVQPTAYLYENGANYYPTIEVQIPLGFAAVRIEVSYSASE